ncbi:MAG: hypothetical protein IJK24_04080 [Oscillospiraceae bacterium]|nr:hypothetical protein [Oscillospiraceae bacterium]
MTPSIPLQRYNVKFYIQSATRREYRVLAVSRKNARKQARKIMKSEIESLKKALKNLNFADTN